MPNLAQIEEALVARLRDKNLSVRDLDKETDKAVVFPAVFVSTDQGTFERAVMNAFRQTARITLTIYFKDVSEKKRRHGVYPILEAIVGILVGQTLGLTIKPLAPIAFRNVTDQALQNDGLAAYSVTFETSYTIAQMDDEEAVALLEIGLNYLLKPGDDVSDATDIVTLPQ
jgi:phage gp37-like protein